jgi:hypothetical protein
MPKPQHPPLDQQVFTRSAHLLRLPTTVHNPLSIMISSTEVATTALNMIHLNARVSASKLAANRNQYPYTELMRRFPAEVFNMIMDHVFALSSKRDDGLLDLTVDCPLSWALFMEPRLSNCTLHRLISKPVHCMVDLSTTAMVQPTVVSEMLLHDFSFTISFPNQHNWHNKTLGTLKALEAALKSARKHTRSDALWSSADEFMLRGHIKLDFTGSSWTSMDISHKATDILINRATRPVVKLAGSRTMWRNSLIKIEVVYSKGDSSRVTSFW